MNIAIYSRKSKFVEGSESIENQIQLCKEYIKHNIKNVDNLLIYEDEGFSGKNVKRPEYQKMMAAAKNKMFSVLVCYKLDRISRNVLDFSDTLETLNKLDISFVSITERFDTNTPMGRAMIYIASVFAQLERETIAERVRDNMIELAKTGKWLGGCPPLGYLKEGIKSNCKIVLDNKTKNIVISLFNKYLELHSMHKTVSWTIENNIKTSKNNFFTIVALKTILANPIYCTADGNFYNYAKKNNMIICNSKEEFKNNNSFGAYCYNKNDHTKCTIRSKNNWIIAIGKHPAIIKSSAWIEAQNIIKENVNKTPRSGTGKTGLLVGLLRCANCGSAMGITFNTNSYNQKFYYYRCRNKNQSRLLCQTKNVRADKLDKEILSKLLDLDSKDNVIYKTLEENKKDNSINNIDKEIKSIEKQIGKNKSAIDKFTLKLIEIDKQNVIKIVENKINKLDVETNDLSKKLMQLKNKKADNHAKEINIDIIKENIKNLSENIDLLTLEEKRGIIKSVIEKIIWDGKKYKIMPRKF